MFPVTVLDNFFETPSFVRDFALQQNFNNKLTYPGIRTDNLKEISPEFYTFFTKKLLSLFFDLSKENIQYNIDARFQLSSAEYEEGWVHTDEEHNFAGVIYLNPNPPNDAGTSVYRKHDNTLLEWEIRNKFYSGDNISSDIVTKARTEHNLHFTKILDVGNVYNRLFLYNANQWHKENRFFGSGKDSRLTLVFFGDIITYQTTQFPIQRTRQFSNY